MLHRRKEERTRLLVQHLPKKWSNYLLHYYNRCNHFHTVTKTMSWQTSAMGRYRLFSLLSISTRPRQVDAWRHTPGLHQKTYTEYLSRTPCSQYRLRSDCCSDVQIHIATQMWPVKRKKHKQWRLSGTSSLAAPYCCANTTLEMYIQAAASPVFMFNTSRTVVWVPSKSIMI